MANRNGADMGWSLIQLGPHSFEIVAGPDLGYGTEIDVVPRSELEAATVAARGHALTIVDLAAAYEERDGLVAEVERLRGLLTEAAHYLDSCGCDDDHCPGRQKAAQLHAALSGPAGSDDAA